MSSKYDGKSLHVDVYKQSTVYSAECVITRARDYILTALQKGEKSALTRDYGLNQEYAVGVAKQNKRNSEGVKSKLVIFGGL